MIGRPRLLINHRTTMSENDDKPGKADHLRPYQWQKGESGNPSGRPKGRPSIEAEIRRRLSQDEDGSQLVEALVMAAIKKALKGDHRFWTSIIERLDGKVAERLAGPDGEGLTVILERFVKGDGEGEDEDGGD
jgi:hypothetical protein